MKGKICIIGGGPAGLSAALQGAKLGYKVQLFERRNIGDDIRCAEGFIDTLGMLGRPPAGVRFKVEKMVVQALDVYEIDVTANSNFYMIDRREWQQDLARRAERAGVEIHEHCRIAPAALSRIKQEYDWVIDASGVPSVTSRVYGFVNAYHASQGITVSKVLEGDFSHLEGKIKVGLEPHYIGYYWIFPKGTVQGRQTANVGLGRFNYKRGPAGNSRLWDELEQVIKKEGLEEYKVLRSFGGVLPIKMLPRVVYDNIILVGDAGGLCSPFHGGGIDLACITGKLAVDAIEAGEVACYRERVWEIVGRKLEVERKMTQIWEKQDLKNIDTIIKLMAERRVASVLDAALHLPRINFDDLKTVYTFVKEFLLTQKREEQLFEQ